MKPLREVADEKFGTEFTKEKSNFLDEVQRKNLDKVGDEVELLLDKYFTYDKKHGDHRWYDNEETGWIINQVGFQPKIEGKLWTIKTLVGAFIDDRTGSVTKYFSQYPEFVNNILHKLTTDL